MLDEAATPPLRIMIQSRAKDAASPARRRQRVRWLALVVARLGVDRIRSPPSAGDPLDHSEDRPTTPGVTNTTAETNERVAGHRAPGDANWAPEQRCALRHRSELDRGVSSLADQTAPGSDGVTAPERVHGAYAGNDASTFGGGAAVRASGQQNHGLVATASGLQADGVQAMHCRERDGHPRDGVRRRGDAGRGPDRRHGRGDRDRDYWQLRLASGGGTSVGVRGESASEPRRPRDERQRRLRYSGQGASDSVGVNGSRNQAFMGRARSCTGEASRPWRNRDDRHRWHRWRPAARWRIRMASLSAPSRRP